MASSSVSSSSSSSVLSVRVRILDRHHIVLPTEDEVKKRGRRRYINDENATAYIIFSSSSSNSASLYDILRIKKDESSLLVGDGDNGIVCHLIRSGRTANNEDERSLSTPVIVRKLAFASLPNTNNESSSSNAALPTHNSSSEDGTTTTIMPSLLPILYIPPCLAATLGLLMLHTIIHTTNDTTNTNNTNNSNNNNNNTIMGGVYYCNLQPIQKCEIYIASHVTVRELGKLPPPSVVVPSVKYPISILDNNNNNEDEDDDDGRGSNKMEKEEERELKHYFF